MWILSEDSSSLAYGVPESSSIFYIGCADGGTMEFRADLPSKPDEVFSEGEPTKIDLVGPNGRETLTGQVSEGDGWSFETTLSADNAVVDALKPGKQITISRGKSAYSIPGKGLAAHIKKLVSTCDRSRSSDTGEGNSGKTPDAVTIRGTIKYGTLDSAIGNYSFLSSSPEAKTIFAQCKLDEQCEVVASVKGESLQKVHSVRRIP